MLAFSASPGETVCVRARAKVNLGLEVLGRRPDGYHELRSVMWAIELADGVVLEPGGTDIRVECAAADVPRTQDNLAYRAAELVRQEATITSGIRIQLDKAIPVAAGLGGGSADAAAVLAGIGRAWRVRLGTARLRALAARLGMDVPFFLGTSPALATGRGERLRPLPRAADLPLVLVNPGFPLATRAVYGQVGPADWTDGRAVQALVAALGRGPAAVAACLTNGLERAAARLWPGLAELKARLVEAGCLGALMSGSGPTVFGIAPTHRAAARIAERLAGDGWRVWATRTVSGPALTMRAAGGARRARRRTPWGVAKR